MDALQKQGETIIKRNNPKLSDSQVKRIHLICSFRNNNICKKHYVSQIEQSTEYSHYYLEEVTSFAKLLSKNPQLLRNQDKFLKEANN